jgi:hypothetical protein
MNVFQAYAEVHEAVAIAPVIVPLKGRGIGGQIIAGRAAVLGQFPWQASLYFPFVKYPKLVLKFT